MAAAAKKTTKAFLSSQLGRVEKVLIETRNKDGYYEGYTPNYTPVFVKAENDRVGEIVDVRLISVEGDHCIGVINE